MWWVRAGRSRQWRFYLKSLINKSLTKLEKTAAAQFLVKQVNVSKTLLAKIINNSGENSIVNINQLDEFLTNGKKIVTDGEEILIKDADDKIIAKFENGEFRLVNGAGGNILERYRVAIFDKVKIITKDKSLPQFIKESFLDNYYYTVEALENIVVFRRFGGSISQAKLFGGFSSTEAVLGRNELAILKKWSTMQFEAELIVEKGAKLNLGKIAPQSVYSCGTDQVLLPLGYPENWIKSIKDLKTATLYSLAEFRVAFPDPIK